MFNLLVGTQITIVLISLLIIFAVVATSFKPLFLAVTFILAKLLFFTPVTNFTVSCVDYVKANPLKFAGESTIFLILGLFVALLKWRNLIVKHVRMNIVLAKSRMVIKNIDAMETSVKSETDKIKSLLPDVGTNKSLIASWIAFWPFHFLDYLINLVFNDLFEKIVELSKSLFTKVSTMVSNKLLKEYTDIVLEEQKAASKDLSV